MFDRCFERPRGPSLGLALPKARRELIELPYLAISSPKHIAATGVLKVEGGKLLEAARPVESGCALVRDRLIVRERVGPRRLNSLLIEALGIEHTVRESRSLRANECRTAREVFRAVLGPFLDLTAVGR